MKINNKALEPVWKSLNDSNKPAEFFETLKTVLEQTGERCIRITLGGENPALILTARLPENREPQE